MACLDVSARLKQARCISKIQSGLENGRKPHHTCADGVQIHSKELHKDCLAEMYYRDAVHRWQGHQRNPAPRDRQAVAQRLSSYCVRSATIGSTFVARRAGM